MAPTLMLQVDPLNCFINDLSRVHTTIVRSLLECTTDVDAAGESDGTTLHVSSIG